MSAFLPLLDVVRNRVQSPVALVLGAPRVAAQLVERLSPATVVCYQMDLFQAERLREELAAAQLTAEVRTAPDLWDLPAEFQTVLFPSPPRGERELKIDMVEQAFHILRKNGTLVALSPVEHDQLFPKLLKKIFGKASITDLGKEGMAVWAARDGDRPRRRHEVVVQARVDEGESLRFVTRPGTFAYGQLDQGSRALLTAAEVRPGDRILDLGCGAGATGIAAWRRTGGTGHVTFVDSNVRAVTLAEMNAIAAGVTDFRAIAAVRAEGLAEASYDVILTNPPYYALESIAHLFVDRSKVLLKPGGRFFLVTKQLDLAQPIVERAYPDAEMFENRGYIIFVSTRPI
jgi:16S rRNA (guanine1207-N2)-methyltransferase